MTQIMIHNYAKALRAMLMSTVMLMSGTTVMADGGGVRIGGSVYGGGNLADVKDNTVVTMSTGTVAGNVFGGGKGKADEFDCKKAMVGENNKGITGAGTTESPYVLQPGGTTVTITNGTVEGDVYGGGEVGRVERNTIVTIGEAGNASLTPIVKGHVFGAGKGVETHGYSALVRGNATVTIQGQAQVWQNVHGGGEKASVGRYNVRLAGDTEHPEVRIGMPYSLKAGGECTVTIQDNAAIGKEDDANSGDVFGAGQGVTPSYNNEEDDVNRSKRMVIYDAATHTIQKRDTEWNFFVDEDGVEDRTYVWEYFTTEDDYLLYMETLGRASETDVVIGGKRETATTFTSSTNAPTVWGTVYGGSESGFVYYSTEVNMLKGTVNGDMFGGGKGLASFAEAGRVRINTNVTISDGTVGGNVYGGGSLGDVGIIDKTNKDDKGQLTYNYFWKQTDGATANTTGYNVPSDNGHDTSKNTGICNVTISGGTIGTNGSADADHGNVFGAGRGTGITWWCEKAIAYATVVSVSGSTVVHGNVYGGGQVGRVEDDGKVTIGTATDTGEGSKPDIKGDVFGAGAGLATHGYSALLRGNSEVTVQGIAKVGGNVYGGGEIASVGRFTVVKGLPTKPDTGGTCIVNVKDNATIGASGTTDYNVYGACKGVKPTYTVATYKDFPSMQLYANRGDGAEHDTWDYYKPYSEDYTGDKFVWKYYKTEADYLAFLKTLALTSNPHVTIGGTWTKTGETESVTPSSGTPSVNGSVFGGGQRGVTLGSVDVNIVGGTIGKDVYGGGALADTNLGNWDVNGYVVATALNQGESITDLYARTGAGTTENPYKYTKITDPATTIDSGTYYRQQATWAHDNGSAYYKTTVDLTGGYIKGDAYGGGLGQKTGFRDAEGNIATKDIPAVVWGDIDVTLDGTKFDITYDETTDQETDDEGYPVTQGGNPVYVKVVKSGRVFGCNNLLGSPQGDVTVTVNRTVEGNTPRTSGTFTDDNGEEIDNRKNKNESVHKYELAAVYGGGNLAPYEPPTSGKKAHVIINGCDATSILTVYGGGNAAPVPETDVDIISCFEIGSVFGGGNGHDKYKKGDNWEVNPGADVNGQANTIIYGGTVHEAYGASNEKGTIHGDVVIDVSNVLPSGGTSTCPLDVAKLVGAGKNADVNGDLIIIMGCKPNVQIPEVYGGADNANVNGDVELTITSGWFGKVFGGNNTNGSIMGHIKLNIEETGTCDTPIKIEELYLGGNKAAYSQYGYYKYSTNQVTGKPILKPRTAAMADSSNPDYKHAITTEEYGSEIRKTAPYEAPELNIISCTYIREVFGGGLGEKAIMYGNPTVNINMEPGALAHLIDRVAPAGADNNANALGEIGDVYGGGNAAAVYGTTTVNIGTETEVQMTSVKEGGVLLATQPKHTVTGAYIVGNVYGGGKLADVGHCTEVDDEQVEDRKNNKVDQAGNTNVNIGVKYNTTTEKWESVPEGTAGVIIAGNVYGGGKGSDESFYCDKAMVLGNLGLSQGGGTNVRIGNGTVKYTADANGNTLTGNVYGGGEIARVENNTAVTIGFGPGNPTTPTSKPVIEGSVFGAGAGLRTHGYSALVRGHSSVTIEGNAKVMQSVYGGGEMATVGRYQVTNNIAEYNISGGESTVTIGGYAEIGPNDMLMYNTTTGKPDDYGHVFGAGKGIQPYEGFEDSEQPWSKIPNGEVKYKKFEALGGNEKLPEDYVTYIRTLALTTETDVTIKDHAFVKGCVFGGSENGFVQKNTHVTIQDDCQIGNGYVQMDNNGVYLNKLEPSVTPMSVNRRYTDEEWRLGKLIPDETKEHDLYTLVHDKYYTSSLPECASWPYGQAANAADRYAPYDPNYGASGYDSKGGRTVADDGHTFYGSVFGGGSGYYPYKPGRWFEDAGAVYGNTTVEITGGHILTSVYGGNEMTSVGKYEFDSDGKPTTTLLSGGKCTITMSAGTLGVPRTLKQIGAHPVTCYLFGAGKGDPRVLFNKSTNVGDVEVNITGGTIYGSVFGGGEDGHVQRDVKMTIGADGVNGASPTGPTIGTWGTSYVDGNVFGGGRGFTGEAYTAGNVAGSIELDIKGGTMLGSIYGGGRLGSVGYDLIEAGAPGYGVMQDDEPAVDPVYYQDGDVIPEGKQLGDEKTPGKAAFRRGHIDITISGGTIGNELEYKLPDTTPNTGNAPSDLNNTNFKTWTDAQWTAWKTHNNIPKTEFDTTTGRVSHTKGGNVFAGGMGNFYKQDGSTPISGGVNWWQFGCAKSTKVTISGDAKIKSSVFGGGELGQVVGYHTTKNAANSDVNVGTEVTINGGTIGTEVKDGSNVVQYTFGSVFGGGYGSLKETLGTDPNISYPKYIAGRVKAGTKVEMTAGRVWASVYGGGEMAAVGESKALKESLTDGFTGDTHVMVSGGEIGKTKDTGHNIPYGGATMGNVYGGGSGHNNTVRSGHVYGNTNVTISAGSVSGEPNIYHNVYGGGAYGSVGDFTYQTGTDAQTGTQKVIGIDNLNENHPNSGVSTVTITGGTIGYDGMNNGMVFGSSRGDINQPGERDDHTAWVYNANVTIGTAATPASGTPDTEGYVAATPASGPDIKGSVYGSGENGHTFNNTVVTVNGGIIGIPSGSEIVVHDPDDPTNSAKDKRYSGAEYPYRGNVYGAGCGTDKYYSDHDLETHDGEGDYYNALAGIVYGTTTVNINDGHVVRNVYGAGAMGSVGKTTWTTVTTTENNVTTTTKEATTTGGLTTVNINGGIIGVSGTVGDGNVFGAARGAKDIVQTDRDDLSRVRETSVTVSGGEVRGNVYGGGELGDVGTIIKNTSYNYTWEKNGSGPNTAGNNGITENNTNTGICNVTITGGTIGSTTAGTGNVFGGGKGDANTWWCEKAMAFATNVSISEASGANTVVYGTVYGGGEIGRVEDDSKVIIGTLDGTDTPDIKGSVFGAGKGLATRGYSALVRGNSIVTVQGSAQVGGNVFGGGEEASLGRFNLVGGLPKSPQSGGYSTVTIQDNAKIGSSGTNNHVYGAGQGVTPNYVGDYKNFKSMQLYGNRPKGAKDVEGTYWDYFINDDGKKDINFVWVYYTTKEEYLDFLKTLALASHPTVTIAENATVFGDVYGGGQRGLTLGNVAVHITGGTVMQDVYGGGSLADTNKGNWDDDRFVATTVASGASVAGLYTDTGNVDSNGNPIYAPTAADATADGSTTYYRKGTWAEGKYNANGTTYKTNVNLTGGTIVGNAYGGGLGQLAKGAVAAQGTEGQEGYVPAQPAVDAVEAKVYGDVLVELNKTTDSDNCVIGSLVNANDPTSRNGNIFGCNNLNGSPQAGVKVHIYKTAHKDNAGNVAADKPAVDIGNYELQAVYGGGNLAAYYPDDETTRATAKTNVIIDGCGLTSIKNVYGGGNAASVPATEVTINGTYEVDHAFGGGNGADPYTLDGKTYLNPGANVGYQSYATHEWDASEGKYVVVENADADTKENREQNYAYGTGVAQITINAGKVHTVYGGSNTKGNVRTESITILDDQSELLTCEFNVDNAYGGGRNADQDGKATLRMECISGLGAIYGGAENADVESIEMNIINGTYSQVFGGNHNGGRVMGNIVVNVEETGCKPVIIGELYGGGNNAGYSIYGYKEVIENGKPVWKPRTSATDDGTGPDTPYADPVVNVKSFTSIGNIFGGGYGADAVIVGNPHLNINVGKGKYYEQTSAERFTGWTLDDANKRYSKTIDEHNVYAPAHEAGAIGAIYNIYGGGNAADVYGDTYVNVGTEEYVEMKTKLTDVRGYCTRTGTGTQNDPYVYSNPITGENAVAPAANTSYYMKVEGVDIRGNVFGGGNAAKVIGNTNVQVGRKVGN